MGSPTLALTIALLCLASSPGLARASPSTPAMSALSQFSAHISHVVFLMQENHAFDNLFGVYCTSTGKYCQNASSGIPPNTCVPKDPARPSLGCITPFNLTPGRVNQDLTHDWASTHAAWNNGSMNGFLKAEGSPLTFGHYNGSTIPLYWDLAEEYGLADHMFSGSMSYSLSNHWDMLAPLPPPVSQKTYVGYSIPVNEQYLNQSNATQSFESTLLNSSVSWKYYDYNLPRTYNLSIGKPGRLSPALDYWNPLAARAQSYNRSVSSHFVARSTFFTDAATGSLPNVSWVIPTDAESDHPPLNLTTGQNWVASVVDAVESSPDWNSTVLFISWDEYGGFYDHVAPPYVDIYGDGFRVPLLAVSPWVSQGTVDHQVLSFSSILRLMEAGFHVKCIGPRDCRAGLPLALFDFNQTRPRPPISFPTNGSAVYPMPLQSSGRLPPFGGPDGFLPNFDPFTGPPPPGTT
ncbi:MAG: hypothetical protein L3K19_04150 [Thermoplasmata archaeon]|nr:hypothetical protein [Thermoplasmata archaeon]